MACEWCRCNCRDWIHTGQGSTRQSNCPVLAVFGRLGIRRRHSRFDAIAANDLRRELVVFQAKRREKLPATLGDADLKAFVGSLTQLGSAASVKKLAATTTNADLKQLLLDLDVAAKINAGYTVRAIFVTNVAANRDATAYLSHAEADGHNVDLWDLNRLRPVLDQLRRDWFVPENVRLEVDPKRLFYVGPSKTEPDLLYAAIRARQLVHLPGIDDSRVFAQNVRLGLGSTRVNDDILESVKHKNEHRDFLNGAATSRYRARGRCTSMPICISTRIIRC